MASLAELIVPMPGKIAVQVDTKDEITPAGLYIPENTARTIHDARPTQGLIVAIGEYENEEDQLQQPILPVDVGDRIIFGKYSGVELKYRPPRVEGEPVPATERIILLEFKSILAKVKNPEDAEKITVKG